MMALRLHERTDITMSSTQLVFRHTAVAGEHPLPHGTSIIQAYEETGQGLLIMGEPGAGKTTLLLELARELLTRAEGDATHPISVILNLSSWANKQPPLATWIIEQLQLVYQVPPRFGQAWLEHDQWLLLLDGLDEVEVSARDACIEAINAYHGEHFNPLVVCSRSQKYLTREARLALPSAIVVQPLQEQLVTDYLKGVGKPLTAVRAALRTNPTLQQLITTPLMLNVIILAYRDKAVTLQPHLSSTRREPERQFLSCFTVTSCMIGNRQQSVLNVLS
jgi:DNA polymerase III delta prime subunit